SVLPGATLATLGVCVKMLLLAAFAYAVTPLDVVESLLLGAVLAPTDAAAVFSVLKGKGLPSRLKGVIEVESGTNDPVSIYLTLTLTAIATSGGTTVWEFAWGVVTQLCIGAVSGIFLGKGLVWLINKISIQSF